MTKQILIIFSFAILLLQAHARVLRLTVRPAVPSITLHSFNGLRDDTKQFTLLNGTATILVPIKEGLLVIDLPGGQEFPLWVALADTGYTMLLTSASATPQLTGSAISQQLYIGMDMVAGLQQRQMALSETRKGLSDTASLSHIINMAQITLNSEMGSLLQQFGLEKGKLANVLLWGSSILPSETAKLTSAGKEREAKASIISFVGAHYAVVAKSNLLRNLINQYLLITEAAPIPPGMPRFEERTRADIAAWAKALKGKCTAGDINNYIIDYFLHHNMWTLCDSLMRNSPNAGCPVPSVTQSGGTGKAMFKSAKADSLDLMQDNKPVLLALYDMDCPSSVAEFVLMRRQLGEGYQPPIKVGMVLLHQDQSGFPGVWQGLPSSIYYNIGQGYGYLSQHLPKNAVVPSYWIRERGGLRYIGHTYHDVKNFFSKNVGEQNR